MMQNDGHRRQYWLYVLRCNGAKWYVGITTKTPEVRFAEHRYNIRAAGWTRMHKPIEIFDRRDLGFVSKEEAENAENRAVRKYIQKYGLNNVRGGNISQTSRYSVFANRLFSQDQWEWFRVSLYFAILSAILLGLYLFEHFTR